MIGRIAPVQAQFDVMTGGRTPMVIVRGWAVMMIDVIMTATIRMHVVRRRPNQGPQDDDRDAGDDQTTHAESVTQDGPAVPESVSARRFAFLTPRPTCPVY